MDPRTDLSEPTPSDLSLDQLVELERRAAEQADADAEDDPGGSTVGELVLPWWQHPLNIVTMVVTAAILAAMVGWLVGDANAGEAHNDVDTGFLQDMRVHHEQAVWISDIYLHRPDIDAGLGVVADQIIVGQSQEIGRMSQLLRVFGESVLNEDEVSMLWMGMSAVPGQMPGIASDDDLDRLSEAEGRAADELFVQLMTAHHLGGIEMAQYAAENGTNDHVVAMAAGMAKGQIGEIAEMEELLARS
jgi:uncharacterized protein (DUF305 family)